MLHVMSLEINTLKKQGRQLASLHWRIKTTHHKLQILQPANLGKVGGPAAPVSNTNIPHAISRLKSLCKYAGFSSASLRTYLSKTSLRHHSRLQHGSSPRSSHAYMREAAIAGGKSRHVCADLTYHDGLGKRDVQRRGWR